MHGIERRGEEGVEGGLNVSSYGVLRMKLFDRMFVFYPLMLQSTRRPELMLRLGDKI